MQLTLNEHLEIVRGLEAGGSPLHRVGTEALEKGERKLDPWESFYFRKLSKEEVALAWERAEETQQRHRGSAKQLVMSGNAEFIGKAGELAAELFMGYLLGSPLDAEDGENGVGDTRHPWRSFCQENLGRRGDICDFEAYGLRIDWKTRQIHTDDFIGLTFDLRVPRHEVNKFQDLYILSAFCPDTSYAYVLGWCPFEELQAKEINEAVTYPAKCVPLSELYRMDGLVPYLQARAAFKR